MGLPITPLRPEHYLHIVGRRNHGKTTLIEELVEELRGRNLKVATIKHSSHVHELDTPGKDSYRHRHAGAEPAAIVTPELTAVYITPRQTAEQNKISTRCAYHQLAPLFQHADVVLVEGGIEGPGIKLELWRAKLNTRPIFKDRDDIVAVITEDSPKTSIPIWPRRPLSLLGDKIIHLIGSISNSGRSGNGAR